MPNTVNHSHDISLQDAAQLTKNYRDAHPGAVIAQRFEKSAIADIINQEGCVSIRIYYAQTSGGAPQLVITGVDCNNNDMYTGKLVEYGHPCPSDCSSSNPLNS